MKLRYLATDLDGTLLTSAKTISPRSQEVLAQAQRCGMTLILASGRPLYSILPFAEELEMQKYRGFIISFNGTEIKGSSEFISLVRKCKVGDTVTVVVSRGGQQIEIKTVLEELQQ